MRPFALRAASSSSTLAVRTSNGDGCFGTTGGVVGWFIINGVNAALRVFFGWFNRFFDAVVAVYGRIVGELLRIVVVALAIYGGLLVFTYWQFNRAPTGFIPQQDKGYLLLNVQLPDSASVERTQTVMNRIEQIARDTPGVEHTVGITGQSLLLGWIRGGLPLRQQ